MTKQKDRVIVVYTGEGKGKTSASLGLTMRALGAGHRVAFVQFIKLWDVSEHTFIQTIMPLYEKQFDFYKGGLGFFEAGDLSSAATEAEHKAHAQATFDFAYAAATSGDYQLVVCDEINNAVADGLIAQSDLARLLKDAHPSTSLCLSGRHFPTELLDHVDIATEMTKLIHHYDDGFIANKGIDY
jgi:cob(I)alamin adenosyltransferase